MKKLLTLVLCWLIAFSAMAENTFKAKTAASVAGGYLTSLNKVDGSFEDVVTQWVASVGTITPTASTEFQGEKKGVWAGTGTGTLDLQWTATASNTYEATAQVNVNGEDDMYICAYVGTTETGCKLIPALNKIQKVSVVADSILSSAFNLRLKHTGSDAFSVDVDDGKIEPWTPQAVNLVEQESVSFTGYSSGTNPIVFKTKDTERSNEKNLISVSTVGSAGTVSRYTVLKPCIVNVVATGDFPSSGAYYLAIGHFNSSGVEIKYADNYIGNGATSDLTAAMTTKANVGDYFIVKTNNAILDNVTANFSITATAISDNVVQSWQDGTEWTPFTAAQINATGISTASLGTIASGQLEYKKSGSDLLIKGRITVGTTAAQEARIPLPIGLVSASGIYHASTEKVGDVGINTVSGSITYHVLSEPNKPYLTFSYQYGASAGLNKTNGDNLISSNNEMSLVARVPIQGWSSTPTLLALPTSKENVFSAFINANNTFRSTNTDWIGQVTTQSAGVKRITFKPGIFTVAPVVVSLYGDGGSTYTERISWSVGTQTATYVDIATAGSASMDSTVPFNIVVMKQSPDYTAPGVFISNLNPDGFNRTLGTAGLIDNFSFSYGTTNATTVCSASPCSYLDQIGNYVTSVTRSAMGVYVANLAKTFSKLKCNLNARTGAYLTTSPVRCESCSSITFGTDTTGGGASDSFGTLVCQGQ